MDLKLTPLFEEHRKLGAKIEAFAGWSMPIQYHSIISEHNWTRSSCSLFDTCHMGEFIIHGEPKKSNLDMVLTADLENMDINSCRYCFMLNENGGIIDDLLIYKIEKDKWMLVVNAATSKKDEAHLRKHLHTKLENSSEDTAKLDLQGPFSRDVLRDLVGPDIDRLKYYHFDYFFILGEKVLISRTGYTGELGYELYVGSERVGELWELILSDKRVGPAGLGARDTLRLEMGYPLYGQDMDEKTTPIEAGLVRFVYLEKEFIGRSVLLKQKEEGVKKRFICFIANSRRSPRHNYKIYIDKNEIGFVTSGTFSPSLSCGIGMGYIDPDYYKIGSEIAIREGRIEIGAIITNRPFYKRGSLRD